MVRKYVVPLIVGLVVVALLVSGYFFVLKMMVKPYYFTLNDLRLRIEQRENERKHLGISVSRAEREQILVERFGQLPTENEVNLQIQIAKGWIKFCVILFGVLAFGTMLSYLIGKKRQGYGRLARHITALPAFAFALPVLFFNDAALTILKPLIALFSLVFLLTVFFTLRSEQSTKSTEIPESHI